MKMQLKNKTVSLPSHFPVFGGLILAPLHYMYKVIPIIYKTGFKMELVPPLRDFLPIYSEEHL